jgi:DNA-binding GntR family transcriptional regulator
VIYNEKTTGAPDTTLAGRAYEALKERILSLELRPGQFLNEQVLGQMIGLGRMPVHQAVHRLMTDGLLEVIPRKGVLIRSDSLNEILALLEARSAVEPNIAALAAERASAAQIRDIERLLRQSRKLADQRFRREFMALDRGFHQAVAEAAGNRILVDAQRPLHERSARIWSLVVMVRPDGLALTQDEHEAVMEAICKRDPEGARSAMLAHLESLRRRILQGGDGIPAGAEAGERGALASGRRRAAPAKVPAARPARKRPARVA